MPDSGPLLNLDKKQSEDKFVAAKFSRKTAALLLNPGLTWLATVGLVVVIFGLIGFTLWFSFSSTQAVQNVQKFSHLNDLFEQAHYAVGEIESLERLYRLEPGQAVRAKHEAAAASLVTALNEVKSLGEADDQALVAWLLADTRTYMVSIERLFAAVDARDAALETKIDLEEADPLFDKIATAINQAALDHAALSQAHLTALAGTQRLIFVIAPFVLLLGLGLIAFFGLLLRTYRRQMAREKFVNEELQAANRSILSALEKEKELGELKSRFVTMASHEFRTPLTVILSSSELLEAYGHRWSDAKKHDLFGRISKAVATVTRLLDDILLIGRAEAGQLEIRPAEFDLVAFARELTEEVQLSTDPAPALTFSSDEPEIIGRLDESLLRQVLLNLLSNAIKYSAPGSPVRLDLACRDAQAVFKVTDQGIGIPLADQPRLFENFHRASNVGTVAGTGLGLAIVKKAVELHQGRIALTSEPGVGTSVLVSLPLAPPIPH